MTIKGLDNYLSTKIGCNISTGNSIYFRDEDIILYSYNIIKLNKLRYKLQLVTNFGTTNYALNTFKLIISRSFKCYASLIKSLSNKYILSNSPYIFINIGELIEN